MAAHLLPALSAARPLREQEKLDNLCGPLCLTFCARWLGVEADVGRVAQMAGLDPISGTSFAGLARAAARLGLEARCYRLRLRDLRRVTARTPGIAHVGGDHFVVVWMSRPDEVTAVRPPSTSQHVTLRNFGRRWNGAVLVVSRRGEQPAWRSHYLRWAPALAAVMLFGAAWGAFRRRRARPRPAS